MSTWRVTCSLAQAEDATHPGFEIVNADTKFISAGVLSFFRIVPEPEPPQVELCGYVMGDIKDTRDIHKNPLCIRALGHPGKHMDKLKPKWPKKPKLIGVRDFNAPRWDDCVLIDAE